MEALMPPSVVGSGRWSAFAGTAVGDKPAAYIVMMSPGATRVGTGGVKDVVARTAALFCAIALPVSAQKAKTTIKVAGIIRFVSFKGKLLGFTCATILIQKQTPRWPRFSNGIRTDCTARKVI